MTNNNMEENGIYPLSMDAYCGVCKKKTEWLRSGIQKEQVVSVNGFEIRTPEFANYNCSGGCGRTLAMADLEGKVFK